MSKLTSRQTKELRRQDAGRRGGRCYYCNTSMWQDNPAEFAVAHGITINAIWQYQCTTEHLQAKGDGGQNVADNIVAACRFCNQYRHNMPVAPEPEAFRQMALYRIQSKSWQLPNDKAEFQRVLLPKKIRGENVKCSCLFYDFSSNH